MIDPQNPEFFNTPVNPGRPQYGHQLSDPLSVPQVSITTPYYNTPPEIFAETFRSVLVQSFQQWEWIIVNDGSSDVAALRELSVICHEDPRIRVVDHEVNRGLSAARNTAFSNAVCEYVVMLDSDDMLEPTAIEKWLWYLESHPEQSFVHGYSVGFGEREYLWPHGFDDGKANLHQNLIDHTSMVRRSVWQRVHGFDEDLRAGCEDWEFWLRCANAGYWGATIPEYLSWYRRNEGQDKTWSQLTPEGILQMKAELRRRYPELYSGKFPQCVSAAPSAYTPVENAVPFSNQLAKPDGSKRLLLVLPWLVMGGAEQFALEMVQQLRTQGYSVSICTTLQSDNPWLHRFSALTSDVFCLPSFLNESDYPRFLHYLIESRRVDVVMMSNSLLSYQLLPFLRSRFPHVAFVDYNHAEVEHWHSGGHPRRSVGYHELLDLSIVASEHLRKWMADKGAAPERIEVCRVNVDTAVWNPHRFDGELLRRQFDIDEGEAVLLFSGRLSPEKRPNLVLEIMSGLSKLPKSDFVCLVAGDGSELPKVQEYVIDNGLERHVRLLGAVTSEEMQSLQAMADILLLPSSWEGIAVVLYEAMAMQTVPVASDVGGQRELVTPECGFLIPLDQEAEVEVEAYVNALMYLIQHPDERRAMAAAGRQRILDHFTIEDMGDRMTHLLDKACRAAVASPRPTVGEGLGLECATLALEYNRLERTVDSLWSGRSALLDRQPETVMKELEAIRMSRTWRWGHWIARSWPVQMGLWLVRGVKRLTRGMT